MSAARRLATIMILAAALVGAGVADRSFERRAPTAAESPPMPMAARAEARSSAFYCAGATAADGGAANGTVNVVHIGKAPLVGRITVAGSDGSVAEQALTVPPSARLDIALSSLVTAPFASALVVLDGGEAVVEMTASGPLGTSITPCASSASAVWYFAEGVTTRDAREVLSLFNPFPEDALVDLQFLTEEGEVTPEDLTGLTVPGRGVVAIDLGEHVQRREQVATTVSARAGRLVAARLQTFDGSVGRRGMSIALGAPSVGSTWYFPDGLAAEGVTERLQLFNPSPEEATVEVHLTLADSSAEPILLMVPPESRLTVVANEETRIPQNQPHGLIVRETSGVGVVAERTIDTAEPASRRGIAYTLGARLTARRWLVAAGRADTDFDGWIVVLNPSDRPAAVAVSLLDGGTPTPVAALANLQVEAGARLAVRLSDSLRAGLTPLLVTSSVPVVVERDQYRRVGLGTAMAMAVPLRD